MDRYIELSVLKKITNNFSASCKIGGGGYGDVYQGEYLGKIIAVKLLKEFDDAQFMNELDNHKKVQHPNIVKLVGYCYSKRGKHYTPEGPYGPVFGENVHNILCFEYMEDGSLEKNLSEDSLGNDWRTHYEIIKGICLGLRCLHQASILHLDLKPANVLLDKDKTPKIADFGLSRVFKESHSHVILNKVVGTPKYMAPELQRRGETSEKTDIFSLGVTIMDIMAGPQGYSNFSDLNVTEFTNKVVIYWTNKKMKAYLFEVKTCIKIAIECLHLERDKRPTIQEIIRKMDNMETEAPSITQEDTNTPAEEVPKAKKAKIVESAFGKGKTKLVSSENADATSMDISLSTRGPCTDQTRQCKLYPSRCFSRHYHTNTTYLVKESDRVVDSARGAMGSLLDKLGKLVTEDYNLKESIKSDIKSLSVDLCNMHRDLLELENVKGAKPYVKEVRELSYVLENMVDSFLVCVDDSSDSGFRELRHKGLMIWENGMMSHNQIGDVISDIKKQVHDVAENKKKYNLNLNIVVSNATDKAAIQNHRNSAITIGIEQLIGMEVPRGEIIKLFEESANISKQNLKIVSIVGPGGLGKTTLANAVYEKLQQEENYTSYFVPVGRNPNMDEVLKKVISEFDKAFNEPNWEVWRLCKKLQELLRNKRYLIFIDDLWDSCDWQGIKSAFPENKCGSRMIITTRNRNVALACSGNLRYVYSIKQLSAEDSKKLFFRRALRPEKDCPDRVKDIAVDIIKTCGGMPLAINSIASLLAGEDDTAWEYVWKSLGTLTEGKTDHGLMTQILDLSYIHLPDHLKTCLLYVCMYPEDREIEKKDLLRQWVAEGFVHVSTNSRLDAEDVAEHYFQELISMCMLQPGKIDYDNNEVLSCRVHDIILDLVRSKSTEVNFIHVIDGSKQQTWAGGIRRVSVQRGEQSVRNLKTINRGVLKHVRSVFLRQGSLFPDFLAFKYIQILYLEATYLEVDLDLTGISQLLLLRYLKVVGYSYKFPNQIGELQQLETVDLNGSDGRLKNYPSDIVSLPRLSHLRYGNGIVLPDGIGRLKSLRTLEGVCMFESTLENIKGLGELTNLRILQFSSTAFTRSKDTNIIMDVLHSSISKLSTSLRVLNIEEMCTWIQPDMKSWSRTLFPPGSCIRKLDISGGDNLQRCPDWIGQLPHLYSLSIRVNEAANVFSITGELPSLVYFRLQINQPQREKNVESVVISGFKALKHLILNCTELKLTFGAKALPNLEKLELSFCYHMTRELLPDGIEHLPAGTLKEILLNVDHDRDHDRMKDFWESHEYYEEYYEDLRRHKLVVSPLLKMAFEKHHLDVDIVVFFADSYEEYEDEEYSADEVNGSQTSSQVQPNTRELEPGEAQEDSGMVRFDVHPLVDTSLHLAVTAEGSLQLPYTSLQSSIHLTVAPCSSPDTADPIPVGVNNDLLVEQGNNGMLVNAVGQYLDLNSAPPGGPFDLNQAPNEFNDDEECF